GHPSLSLAVHERSIEPAPRIRLARPDRHRPLRPSPDRRRCAGAGSSDEKPPGPPSRLQCGAASTIIAVDHGPRPVWRGPVAGRGRGPVRTRSSAPRGRVAPMAVATTTRRLGATALLGLGLTPGKLRGLQRISNPNGTLTMVAFDQNSSMIDLAQKALKAKGQDREPTFEEIVEAKLDMMKQMAPAASGVLIDAY